MPRFKLGDRVLVEPGAKDGIVIGVRYGEIAYDVLCGRECLINLCSKRVRLAPLSVLDAALWQWDLWGGIVVPPTASAA
jgi:hypothetical protein